MYNVSSATDLLFVCVRCRHRLTTERKAFGLRRGQSSWSTQIRPFHVRSARRTERVQEADGDRRTNVSRTTGRNAIGLSSPRRPGVRPKASYRLNKASVGIDSFGEDAKVLMLGHVERKPDLGVLYTEELPGVLPPASLATSHSILKDLDAERGIIGSDRACRNIDGLRKEFEERGRADEPGLLDPPQYDDLLSRLSNSFEKKHLAEYWRRSGAEANHDPSNMYKSYTCRLYARSAWLSRVSSIEEAQIPTLGAISSNLDSHVASRKLCLQQHKLWHAEQIVEHSWGFRKRQAQHEDSGFVLRLRKTHLDLLLNHSEDPLKSISTAFAINIDADQKTGLIQVSADLPISGDVADMFVRLFHRIERHDVSVSAKAALPGRKRIYDPDYIREVQRLTSTVITTSHPPGLCVFSISYLGPERIDYEDAKRLILQAKSLAELPLSTPERDLFSGQVQVSKATVVPVDVGNSLPLSQRLVSWARFANPAVQRPKLKEGQSVDYERMQKFRRSLTDGSPQADRLNRFFVKGACKPEVYKSRQVRSPYWLQSTSSNLKIRVGQIAFPFKDAQQLRNKFRDSAKSSKRFQHRIGTLERACITTTPGIRRSLQMFTSSDVQALESLKVILIPQTAVGVSPELIHHLPRLEIYVDIDNKSKKTNFMLARLLVQQRRLDMLLPDKSTDLQLTTQLILYENRENVDPVITAFIEASEFNVEGTNRLRTPESLRLSIPAHSIPKSASLDTSVLTDGLFVEYSFEKLEHRSRMELFLNGWQKLVYSTIEAGNTGGRSEELVLSCRNSPELGLILDHRAKAAAKYSPSNTLVNNISKVVELVECQGRLSSSIFADDP